MGINFAVANLHLFQNKKKCPATVGIPIKSYNLKCTILNFYSACNSKNSCLFAPVIRETDLTILFSIISNIKSI